MSIIFKDKNLFSTKFTGYDFKSKEERELFIDNCVKYIRENSIPYPIPIIQEHEARNDYINLKKLDVITIYNSGKWIARKEYKYSYIDKYINTNKIENIYFKNS